MEKRLGFHYFQDYDHYQMRDLELWVPELASLKASWLVLKAPPTAAIPEEFITGLIQAGIQPILHFDFQVNSAVRPEDLRVLLSSYSRWGIKYVIFFDRPNTKAAWTDGSWSQGDLVERFLDRYLPFVSLAEQNSIIPVFPPLEPGGDYWDLSFLKKVLQLVQQRRSFDFSSNFHMAIPSIGVQVARHIGRSRVHIARWIWVKKIILASTPGNGMLTWSKRLSMSTPSFSSFTMACRA